MGRLWIGLGFVVLGLVLALVGRLTTGPDLHPIATGLIAVGLVTAGVALVERRLDQPRDRTPRR